MASIRKAKKRLKRELKNAEIAKRILSHEHYLKRKPSTLMKVTYAREEIERIEEDLRDLKELKPKKQ